MHNTQVLWHFWSLTAKACQLPTPTHRPWLPFPHTTLIPNTQTWLPTTTYEFSAHRFQLATHLIDNNFMTSSRSLMKCYIMWSSSNGSKAPTARYTLDGHSAFGTIMKYINKPVFKLISWEPFSFFHHWHFFNTKQNALEIHFIHILPVQLPHPPSDFKQD